MDIHMPIMSGIEAVKILRARGYSGPITALTANAMQESVKSCLQAGCDTFLAKPIDISEFYTMLNKYLTPDSSLKSTSTPIISTLAEEGDGVFSELIEEFVETLPETLNNIREAFEERDWEKLGDDVHTLKGTGGNYGFEQITRTCQAIEIEMENNNTESISRHIADLEKLYARIKSGLQIA
jgi:HPt (histidine-containing phosphotransfer) domain-containing protein